MADTVAAPIEQQVNGVEGMLYMSSQMGNDGAYTLAVTFDIGTDLDMALVMVQNRVQLAMPLLPLSVQNQGITIRKKTPDILNLINFYSPDGRYDDVYLSNFAQIHVYDELLRIDGVSQINFVGVGNYSMRAWLDPQKLAAMNMTASDVASALGSSEPGRRRRPGGPAAGPQEPGLRATHQYARPTHHHGAIRQHHRQGGTAAAVDSNQRPRHPHAEQFRNVVHERHRILVDRHDDVDDIRRFDVHFDVWLPDFQQFANLELRRGHNLDNEHHVR